MSLIIPAVGIGIGAVGSELVMGYLPLPANFKTGVLRHVTKGGVSVVAGLTIAKFLRMKRVGEAFALGGIAIATHDAIKEWIVSTMPNAKFGEYGMYLAPGAAGRGLGYVNPAQLTNGMGMYMPRVHGLSGSSSGGATGETTGVHDYSGA